MSVSEMKPVLIVGGSGVVGSAAARALRRLQPDLPITVAGRDLTKLRAVAAELGRAEAVTVDLDRADLGLSADAAFSAVATCFKDDTLNSLRYAQAKRIPFTDITTAVFEIGPEVALYIHNPGASAVLMNSGWLAGTAVLPALHFAADFKTIESIEFGLHLDELDMGGAAAYASYERITTVLTTPLILREGKWIWETGPEATRRFTSVDGIEVDGQGLGILDGLSLASATGAKSIRVDVGVGETASRRRGEPFSTEMMIDITGELKDGTSACIRHELVHPQGQAPMTGLGAALGIERLLGLAGGAAVAPGLYLPETIVDPAYAVRRLEEFGTQIRRV